MIQPHTYIPTNRDVTVSDVIPRDIFGAHALPLTGVPEGPDVGRLLGWRVGMSVGDVLGARVGAAVIPHTILPACGKKLLEDTLDDRHWA